jgi:hypothetical protein
MAAIEAVDLVLDGGAGLGGADPGEDLLLRVLVVGVADDAMCAPPGLAERAVGGQQADVAGILAVIVREAEDRHVGRRSS